MTSRAGFLRRGLGGGCCLGGRCAPVIIYATAFAICCGMSALGWSCARRIEAARWRWRRRLGCARRCGCCERRASRFAALEMAAHHRACLGAVDLVVCVCDCRARDRFASCGAGVDCAAGGCDCIVGVSACMFMHAQLGLQVVFEDYVAAPNTRKKIIGGLAVINTLACLAAMTAVVWVAFL